jgi:hypothetical protein
VTGHRPSAMKPKLPRGTLNKLWADPAHWRSPGFYSCQEDPRLFVPKRIQWTGFTPNFAHPASIVLLLIGIIGTGIVVVCLKTSGHDALILPALALLGIHAYLSGRYRCSVERFEEDERG